MNWTVLDEVSVLWAEHLGSPFPDDLYWVDDGDRCLPLTDALMAGCIASYVSGRGVLDLERRRDLQSLARDLAEILPRLRGESAEYVARLVRMAELINSDGRAGVLPVNGQRRRPDRHAADYARGRGG